MPSPDRPVSVYAIIVLYRMAPTDSPTYRTLLESLSQAASGALRYRVLLYDNTPTHQTPEALPAGVQYFASPANRGLAEPYNFAAARAHEEGFEWLLTLDQDTELPASFIPEIADVARMFHGQEEVAAIVPHISSNGRDVSPNWFVGGMLPRWFTAGYRGIPKHPVYAFNSGTMVRTSAIRAMGGYSPLFWLDNCDAYLYRQLEKAGKQVYVAGHIQLQHDFSMLDISGKMSLFRYRNALGAGSAFYDLEMSWLAGVEHTSRLLRRFLKQSLLRENKEVRRATATVLRERLFTPKRKRIQAWLEEQRKRMQQETDPPAIPSEV